jgi:hypothetical protein
VDSNLVYISEQKIDSAVPIFNIFNIFIAAILLVRAIVNLYLEQKKSLLLGLIGAYIACFHCFLVCDKCRRAEFYRSNVA